MNKACAHIFLLALAIVSCTRQETDGGVGAPARTPILFNSGCAPLTVETKAGDTFVDNALATPVVGKSFCVYAWDTGASYLGSNPGSPTFISSGLPVEFTDNDDQGRHNNYDPADLSVPMDQYWPQAADGYAYSFLAYYPYSATPGETGIATPDFSTKVGSFAFTAKTDSGADLAVDDMVDFCVSDVANDQRYGNTTSEYPGTVDLRFHHMLTLVRVCFVKSRDVAADYAIRILDAKLENINTTATLTATYAPPAVPGVNVAGTTSFAWSLWNNPRDYQITFGGVNPEYNSGTGTATNPVTLGYSQVVNKEDFFLLIPQTIWNNDPGNAYPQKIHFWWDTPGGAATEGTVFLYDSVKLIGSEERADISWEPGSFVTYTVVIRTAPIVFGLDTNYDLDVTIEPWPTEDVNGYIQIID